MAKLHSERGIKPEPTHCVDGKICHSPCTQKICFNYCATSESQKDMHEPQYNYLLKFSLHVFCLQVTMKNKKNNKHAPPLRPPASSKDYRGGAYCKLLLAIYSKLVYSSGTSLKNLTRAGVQAPCAS